MVSCKLRILVGSKSLMCYSELVVFQWWPEPVTALVGNTRFSWQNSIVSMLFWSAVHSTNSTTSPKTSVRFQCRSQSVMQPSGFIYKGQLFRQCALRRFALLLPGPSAGVVVRLSSVTKWGSRLSREPFALESQNFTGTSIPTPSNGFGWNSSRTV